MLVVRRHFGEKALQRTTWRTCPFAHQTSSRMPTLVVTEVDASSDEEDEQPMDVRPVVDPMESSVLSSQDRDTIRRRWFREKLSKSKWDAYKQTWLRKHSTMIRVQVSEVNNCKIFATFDAEDKEEEEEEDDDKTTSSFATLVTQAPVHEDRDEAFKIGNDDARDIFAISEHSSDNESWTTSGLYDIGGNGDNVICFGEAEDHIGKDVGEGISLVGDAMDASKESQDVTCEEEENSCKGVLRRSSRCRVTRMSNEKETNDVSEETETTSQTRKKKTTKAATSKKTKATKATKAGVVKRKARAKATIKLVSLADKKKYEYANVVDYWMLTTITIVEKAELTAPRRTWANQLEDLRANKPMLYAWFTCCGMLASPKNKDENVTKFMRYLRENDFTPEGMRKMVDEKGRDTVKAIVANYAKGGFYNLTAGFVMDLYQDFEEKKLWNATWQDISDLVKGAGSKIAIILYEMWHPGECPGIAVDIHVLTLGKSLGIFNYDCSDQELVQRTLEAIIPQAKWPDINLHFGSLFQFLHGSRGDDARHKLLEAAGEIGPEASAMLQLFDSTKKLVTVELLKKQLATVTAAFKTSLEEAATAII
jgi:endonuclease III